MTQWVTVSFYSSYPWKWCIGSAQWLLHGWCHVICCRFGASSVYTIQPCTMLQCHFIQSHIVYAYLAVTCHLHFWQNDRDLLHATAVTRGWNGYRNKSQHRKLTLEKKTLPPPLQGFEPATFQSWVWRSNYWATLLYQMNHPLVGGGADSVCTHVHNYLTPEPCVFSSTSETWLCQTLMPLKTRGCSSCKLICCPATSPSEWPTRFSLSGSQCWCLKPTSRMPNKSQVLQTAF